MSITAFPPRKYPCDDPAVGPAHSVQPDRGIRTPRGGIRNGGLMSRPYGNFTALKGYEAMSTPIGYLRVSTLEQADSRSSLEAQRGKVLS